MHLDLWTLGLQAVNAGVLIWLLARFLFRPVRAIIDQRQAAAAALLADAAAARAKAAADAAEVARQRQGFAAEGDRILAEAHAAAAADATTQRDQAAQAIARMRQDGAAELERERSAMRETLATDAADLAVSIARRLLARVPEPPTTDALLHEVLDRVGQLPPAERSGLAGARVEIVTPTSLGAARQSAWVAALVQAVGAEVQVSFAVDPALLAGVELRAPHTLLRNSWRADLEQITQALRTSRGVLAPAEAG